MALRPARDRRGRGVRGPVLPPQVPRFRSRSERFDMAVLEAYAPIQQSFAAELSHLDIAVDTVPRMRMHADRTVFPEEVVADGPVPLGRVIPAGVDRFGRPTRSRIVVFRQPVEQRCADIESRMELLRRILTCLVAAYLNIEPTDVDPCFRD